MPIRATADTVPGTTQPSLRKPPELDPEESLAGRQKVTTGNANVPYSKGKKGDALTIAVSCQGKGKITVAVRPVSVEASPAVHWSMTIGRGAPAQSRRMPAELGQALLTQE
ncbi:hypothetical protein ACH4ND_26330 [Streptomyces sp. NPDC017179]|uniref:hypothetical protein n=1 Tax=Streptomyces sp. NPDC017179 TaxID=3364979 RepID=UPI00378F564E